MSGLGAVLYILTIFFNFSCHVFCSCCFSSPNPSQIDTPPILLYVLSHKQTEQTPTKLKQHPQEQAHRVDEAILCWPTSLKHDPACSVANITGVTHWRKLVLPSPAGINYK